MVYGTEGSSIRGSPKQDGPLALMLKEGSTHNSRITEIYGPVPS